MKRVLPELQALPTEDLIQVNVDIPTAVSVVLGSLPAIRSYRDAVVKSMNDFDLSAFDKLEDYAIALNEAHGNYLAATQPMDDLDTMLEEGVRLRETLLSDANALAVRGLIDGAKLLELKGPVGHKNLASDLNQLSKMFEAVWAQIPGKSAVTAAEVERASRLNLRIIRVVGLRDQNRVAVAAATDIRIRAFTLLTRAYDSVRRALNFLRW